MRSFVLEGADGLSWRRGVRVVEGFVFRFWLYEADPKVY